MDLDLIVLMTAHNLITKTWTFEDEKQNYCSNHDFAWYLKVARGGQISINSQSKVNVIVCTHSFKNYCSLSISLHYGFL